MTLKKRTSIDLDKNITALVDELADRPYGQKKDSDLILRTTISLPEKILIKLEDTARSNKRKNADLKSVSALIRHCIEKTLNI